MVSQLTMIFMGISAILSILVPTLCLIYFYKKTNISWKTVLVGVIVFIVFSQVLEKILNVYILTVNSSTKELFTNRYLYALYGAISAAFFEEVGRLLGFYYLLKKYREWKDGIGYAIGHGGMEAILIGVFAGIQNLLMSNMINSGGFEKLLSANTSNSSNLLAIKEQLVNTSSYMFLMVGVERIAVFIIQIALSLLVLYGVRTNKKALFLLYAIAAHTSINFMMLASKSIGLHIFIIEGMIILIAIASIFVIKRFKTLFAVNVPYAINNTNKSV
ncbi:YhfC family intramembrane metalloprotease [Bacillus thuringiensis]|uniref:YhfC family intramembrane metalloprotease n=1 Tax=Bacillus thuringiensis TaxID=1428 RepID=UPI000BED2AFB|nr:YhfC family intramembrane metalloprotease [Bacillus thuringiensis]PDY26981.1 YhfC family intramembrane metalloprotease [Bacillus thuringiensis]PGH92607.1 YhfC family intramembrane metalloprotease [Bacillus thuringiensis]